MAVTFVQSFVGARQAGYTDPESVGIGILDAVNPNPFSNGYAKDEQEAEDKQAAQYDLPANMDALNKQFDALPKNPSN